MYCLVTAGTMSIFPIGIDYRRQFRSYQERFDFRAEAVGTHEYAVDGWSSDQVGVWDITDANRPGRLTGVSTESNESVAPLALSGRRRSEFAPLGSRLRVASVRLALQSACGHLPDCAIR